MDADANEEDLRSPQVKTMASSDAESFEVDPGCIVRPERFILPEVSGLTVPTVTIRDGKPAGQWKLYLRWANGQREEMPLPQTITIGGKVAFLHPSPSPPSITMPCGWSADARRRWLASKLAKSPQEVFEEVRERIDYYLDFPIDQAERITATLATWVLLTYCYSAWPAVPYLHFGGAKGSGKTTAFQVLERLAFRAFSASSLTAAVMYRTLHSQGGTLLFDEAERLGTPNRAAAGELYAMLLAGYKRGGRAMRIEQIGKSRLPVAFDVFGPKAFACIAGLPPALASRCISIIMLRAAPNSPKLRRRLDQEPERWQQVRDDLHALALENGSEWLALAERDGVCPDLSGRAYELWQPLLALAAWLDSRGVNGLLHVMQQHAQQTIDAAADDDTFGPDAVLLRVLADAVRAGERLSAADLLAKAQEREASTFRAWTPQGVAQRLRSYGIPPTTKVNGRREYRDVTPEHLRQIQIVHGIDLGCDDLVGNVEVAGQER